VVFCTVRALLEVPDLNVEFFDGVVHRSAEVHLAFACDTDRGLVVPVVRDCQDLSLVGLAEEAGPAYKNIDDVVEATEAAGVPYVLYRNNLVGDGPRDAVDQVRADGEIARAGELGVQLLTWADAGYPAALKAIADPPLVLYVAGAVEPLAGPSIAVIGTRHPTMYGREMAQLLAFQLAGAGYVIVSGLALGIDSQAHRSALAAGGRGRRMWGLQKSYVPMRSSQNFS